MSFPSAIFALEYGTSEEAKAMLERAVEAINHNKSKALVSFTEGDNRFKHKDLYVFCFDAQTGEILAHGAQKSRIGKNVRQIKDKYGTPFGEELFKSAEEGELREVNYLRARPGETEPSQKSSYIIRVEGISCGVGYYK
jgi:signal transduction histidine kinase